jgi:hypothetical protein
LRSLIALCHQLGGKLEIISKDHYLKIRDGKHFFDTPFTRGHGIDWRKKIIYAVEGEEEVGSIIHEMGHVFAERGNPNSARCSEWRWFGWEIATARHARAVAIWNRQNSNYFTGEEDWGDLSEYRRREVGGERVKHAKRLGLVAADGTPRSVR